MNIAITGPESSGKTSISIALAQYFQGYWFPEYARTYLLNQDGVYHFDDIEIIAIEQERLRQEYPTKEWNFYDTENIVLYIWSIFKYNQCTSKVRSLMENQQFDHYFLCSPEDIPWEDDPLRENPYQRVELFELYLHQLKKQQVDFTILKGNFQKRMEHAIETLKKDT